MILSSIEKISHSIGFDIGTSNDEVQINLINGFCDGICNSIPQNHDRESQVCYIAKGLSKKSEGVILALVEFINLKNKEEY